LTAETSARDVVLFQPSEAIAVVQGGDNGTPWQKDEPQAENPPSGAVIDYYLRSAANGPVRIEILDSAGAVVRTYSSDAPSAPAETPQTVSALWRRPAPTVATAAGMHRWIWDLRDTPPAATGGPGGGGGRRPLPMRTGSFTVRLTANGQTQTAPLRVVPDPRTR
jgi:hypothetical protein